MSTPTSPHSPRTSIVAEKQPWATPVKPKSPSIDWSSLSPAIMEKFTGIASAFKNMFSPVEPKETPRNESTRLDFKDESDIQEDYSDKESYPQLFDGESKQVNTPEPFFLYSQNEKDSLLKKVWETVKEFFNRLAEQVIHFKEQMVVKCSNHLNSRLFLNLRNLDLNSLSLRNLQNFFYS